MICWPFRLGHTKILNTASKQRGHPQSRTADYIEQEECEVLLIAVPHTVVNTEAVVVHMVHTSLADGAMVRTMRLPLSAWFALSLLLVAVFRGWQGRRAPSVTERCSQVTDQSHPEAELEEQVYVRSEVGETEIAFCICEPGPQCPLQHHPSA